MAARILLSLLVVVALIESSDAIKCFHCDADNPLCNDGAFVSAVVPKCTGQYSCVKFTADVSVLGVHPTARTCGDGPVGAELCVSTTLQNNQGETLRGKACSCDTDLCNVTSVLKSVRFHTAVMLAAISLFMIKKAD